MTALCVGHNGNVRFVVLCLPTVMLLESCSIKGMKTHSMLEQNTNMKLCTAALKQLMRTTVNVYSSSEWLCWYMISGRRSQDNGQPVSYTCWIHHSGILRAWIEISITPTTLLARLLFIIRIMFYWLKCCKPSFGDFFIGWKCASSIANSYTEHVIWVPNGTRYNYKILSLCVCIEKKYLIFFCLCHKTHTKAHY